MQTNPEQWAVDFAHELWPMAQVGPSEGIEDAALRIASAIQAAFAEQNARLVGALELVGKILPSAAGLDDAPNSKAIPFYINMGELRAIKATLAALKDRTDD